MNLPKKHHILPQCYLSNFKNFKDKIGVMKTYPGRDKVRWSHTSGMGYKENYFKVEPFSFSKNIDIDPLIIESKHNKKYEDILPEYWNKLKGESLELSVNDKYTIAEIIYHLKNRTQFTRNFFFNEEASNHLVEETSEAVLPYLWEKQKEYYIQYGLDFPQYASLMKGMMQNNYTKKDKNSIHNNFLHWQSSKIDSSIKKQALWRLVQSPWTVLHSNIEATFITTDNPGASEYNNEIFNFLGDSSSKFDFYFPISSNRVLKVECRKKQVDDNVLFDLKHVNLTSSETNRINLYLLMNSVEEVYGPDEDTLIKLKHELVDKKKYIPKNISLLDLLEKYPPSNKY